MTFQANVLTSHEKDVLKNTLNVAIRVAERKLLLIEVEGQQPYRQTKSSVRAELNTLIGLRDLLGGDYVSVTTMHV